MERAVIPVNKFNAKRPGSLVGTITEVSGYVRLLFTLIGKGRDGDGGSIVQAFSEKSSSGSWFCPACQGNGTVNGDLDPDRMIALELSLKRGAVLLWAGTNCGPVAKIKALAEMIGIGFERPLAEQDRRFVDILLYGYDKEPVAYVHKKRQFIAYYRGCVFDLQYMRDAGTTSKGNLRAIDYFSRKEKCPACNESELNHDIKMIQGRSLAEALQLPLPELLLFVQGLSPSLDEREWKNSHAVIEEIELRLVYLNKIGLKAL